MKVKNCMQKDLVLVGKDALLQEAGALMKKHSIRHLPVVEDGQLVGFITESDLRQYSFPSQEKDIHVHEVMVLNPITVNINASIEKAARLIHDYKIGGLPVLDKKKLVGIITAIDLLSAFINMMGLLRASSRLDVLVGKVGGVEDVTRIIKEHGCEIISVATESHSSRRKLYCFRLEKGELDKAIDALEEAGHKVVSVED
ncbi:MAG: CBS and ACT domain-containing protein [Desulfobulbaceae bacterium]|nr:CBS and ACT domain-containing protein [Desulfobulbaceae bacterium]HIJ90048.1 CBS domain-containing protein [Deltaproteobacteria bacterium]